MNLDERLEALTHSVELLASMQRDTESRIAQLAKNQKRLEQLATEIAEGTARVIAYRGVARTAHQRFRSESTAVKHQRPLCVLATRQRGLTKVRVPRTPTQWLHPLQHTLLTPSSNTTAG